jgi:ATP-binding cassette, subfamily F, member 3
VPKPAGVEPPPAPAAAAPTARGALRPAPAPQAPREDRKAEKQARAKMAEATRPKRVELQRIDERLAKLVKEKATVEARLADPGTKPAGIADLGRELSHIQAEVAMLEERWLELQGELERLQESS